MSKPPSLTTVQRTRLKVLEPALRVAVYQADYDRAKLIAADIQSLLRGSEHEARLMQAKIWLFEAAINAGQLYIAQAGLTGVRSKTGTGSTVHQEATALLVVCFLRQGKLSEAEPLIAALVRSKAIRDPIRREAFIRSITNRFSQESYLFAVRGLEDDKRLDVNDVDAEAIEFEKKYTTEELYALVAQALPRAAIEFVYRVDQTTRKQLTAAEVRFLPSPESIQEKKLQGRTFFSSLKLVIWKSLCDPQSEVYKAWYTNGIVHVLSKKYYSFVIASALFDIGFAAKAVAVPVTALLMKIGLEVYCDRYKPAEILESKAK